MKPIDKDRFLIWFAVPLLAAVLVILAMMQHHWSQAIGAATRTRIRAGLQNSLTGFHEDLSRELGTLCAEILSAADHERDSAAAISGQIAHWQRSALHPALLANVYLSQEQGAKLLRIDPATGKSETVPWPPEFTPLREHLQAAFPAQDFIMSSPPQMHARHHLLHERMRSTLRGSEHAAPPPVPWAMDQSTLALISPVHRNGHDRQGPALSWLIVQLDRAVLEKEVFPDLVQKYFRGQANLDFAVAVVESGGPQRRVAYSSVAGFGEDSAAPVDAAMTLLGPPVRRERGRGPDTGFVDPAGLHAPPEYRRGPGMRFEPLHYLSDQGAYEILVRHEKGSLEAAVNGLRWRNLMLSFGVLGLMGVTMGLILFATHRARRLARMQMDFVAGVSHELRTPLAVISSAAENIADGVVEDRERLAQYGASILRQSRHLTHLVEQVLLYAATQQARRQYDIQPVHVEAIVAAALEGTASVMKSSGFRLDMQIEPGLPPARADFHAVVESLQNLITNAVKYGANGRWLGIRAEAAKEAGRPREILLSVEDRGMGVRRDELKLIFEPFYRSASAIDAQIHGTGLGLPLARTLIEAIGGRLTAQSEPGRGSTFTIHLPAMEEPRAAESHAAGKAAAAETTS